MTARVLPFIEWAKLAGTELDPLVNRFTDDELRVIVVEDKGQIIGCWGRLMMAHVEGFWIAPSQRRRGGRAMRTLFNAMVADTREAGLASVVTGAANEEVARLLTYCGAQALPPA